MTNSEIKKGLKLNLRREALLSFGNGENNKPVVKEINSVKEYNGVPDYFTFKGGKTEYRLCGNKIYSITGPVREYIILN